MLDELKSWLELFVPIEVVDLYITAFEDFQDIGELGAETEFGLLWNEKDRLYNGTMLESLKTILVAGATDILRKHGIFFTQDTSLPLLVKAVESLIWLNNTSDHDDILNIFSSDIADVDKVAELFRYVNNDSLEMWQDSLKEVSQLFIQKVLDEQSETHSITPTYSEYDMSVLTRYDVKFQNRVYRKALEFGANPGIIPAPTLLEMFRDHLSAFCPFSPRDAAIDIAGLVIFSDMPQKNLAKESGLMAEKLYADVAFLTALKVQLGQVFGEIGIYG